MAQEGRTPLKTYFNTGDIPTEGQYGNLIDSSVNKVDDPLILLFNPEVLDPSAKDGDLAINRVTRQFYRRVSGAWQLEGTLGLKFLVDSGAPVIATGNDGDMYLDSDTKDLYGPKAGGAWGSAITLGGSGGSTFQFRNGSGAPDDLVGADGDMYIDTSSDNLYTKASGTWGAPITNIGGANGDSGSSFLIGSGVPANGLGADGDTYADADDSQIYTKAAGSWTATGTYIRGNSILSGSGSPGPTLGIDGDTYLDIDTGDLWGPKAASSWGGTASGSLASTSSTDIVVTGHTATQLELQSSTAAGANPVLSSATNALAGLLSATDKIRIDAAIELDDTSIVDGDLVQWDLANTQLIPVPGERVDATAGDVGSIKTHSKKGNTYGYANPHTLATLTIDSANVAEDGFAKVYIQNASSPTISASGAGTIQEATDWANWDAANINHVLIECRVSGGTPVWDVYHVGVTTA